MLTAVVTQVGEQFTVHVSLGTTTVPPTTPVQETSTNDAATTAHDSNVTLATDGYVAEDGIGHTTAERAAPGPNPIVPEIKEVAWGAGAFIVFAIVMRYVAFPRLKNGMDARYNGIRSDHDLAAATRAAAQTDVADYQAQLAMVKAEAAARLDRARQELETQRTARIATANTEIAERRSAASAENAAARAAVQGQIQGAVADVSSSAIALAIGKTPDPAVVSRVVDDVMSAGANR